MSKCRKEFERICGINQVCADGQYGEEIYEWFVFAWNARGKVDYQHADANYADDFVLKAIEQENEK